MSDDDGNTLKHYQHKSTTIVVRENLPCGGLTVVSSWILLATKGGNLCHVSSTSSVKLRPESLACQRTPDCFLVNPVFVLISIEECLDISPRPVLGMPATVLEADMLTAGEMDEGGQ